jgi:hypothetical protein
MPHKSIGGDGMSNIKSRKLINIMLSAMMLLGVSADQSFAAERNYGKNGVSYVLLSSDFSSPGVYRFNKFDGKIREDYLNPNPNVKLPLFKINTIEGKVSGLAANQENNVFLLSAIEGVGFKDADPGWLPTGIKFDENSAIYLSAAKPDEGGAVDYIRTGCPHISDWNTHTGSYWKHDYTINNTKYKYVVTFGGPKGVKYFNGESGTTGTPIWDGTYTTGGISKGAAIKHPTDERKIILPSHFGALSYYLYGTKNEPAIEGLVMDGSNGRDTYIFTDATGRGVFPGDSKHGNATMFGCIVKRFYQKRENSLNLYAGNDNTVEGNVPSNQTMAQTQSNVLKTVDVKVREAYGKLCGDNCIDGGEIAGAEVETALSTVTVVTSTTGNRYGFNPLGVYRKADTQDQTSAALRVVKTNGTTKTVDLSTDKEGQTFSPEITNKAYLVNQNITPAEIRTIGISSKFGSDLDYIYGSGADYFVVQDSWWGKGGIAYEYYKGNEENPGKVVKIDYMNNDGQKSSEELGDLTGKVDGIGIDGDGYLYALKTEEYPSNSVMSDASPNPDPSATEIKFGDDKLEVTFSGWRRDIKTTTNDETINDGYIDIPNGQEQEGDYKLATVKQNVYKTVKRYPQATGKLGTEEDRGSMFAGYDTWTNKLKMTKRGYTWDYTQWREEEGTRTSDMLAELAVVNVADAPKALPGTTEHYVTVIDAQNDIGDSVSYTNDQVISEENSLTFKVEGYKPKIKGEPRDFKDIGDIDGTNYKNVKLNSIPAEDGTYAHDEDGDDNKSGFPSSMFEASGFDTKVTWKIAQVENTSAVALDSRFVKLVSSIESIEGTGKYKSLNYKFKQPGRYIIQAEVTYNYFNNLGQSGIRPNQLTVSQETFTTQPKLVQVYANALKLNQSPSYITNIKMEKVAPSDNNSFGITGGSSGSTYDAVEGLASKTVDVDAGKFGALKISFNAQFVREVENNTTGNLQTYDGIGVWDYNYYKLLYTQAKAQMPGIIEPNISVTSRAYNHISDGDPSQAYSPTIYNPGKAKATSGSDYTAGTKVSGSINEAGNLDKQFIQWALYLRPVSPQGDVSTEANAIYDRGSLIVSGTCATATFTPIGDESNRNYKVSFTIDQIDSKINTPRDPRDYTIDLEIIYPRVSWLNNDLGANLNDGHNYYSSIVPYSPVNQVTPIHVLSKLYLNSTDNKINQSYKIEEGSLYADDKQPYFTLCVRDKETPGFNDNTSGLPFIETTGEPTIAGNFKYQVIDNNPYLSLTEFDNASARKITTEELTNAAEPATNIIIQDLVENKFLTNDNVSTYESNIKFTKLEPGETSAEINQTSDESKLSDGTSFCATDSWRLWIDFNTKVSSLSPQKFTPQTSQEPAVKYETLSMENWVGTLKYAVTGKFYDGLGKDGNYTAHNLYDTDSASKPGYPQITDSKELEEIIPAPAKEYLKRIDNDPPSIQVDLVSQSDNRRWVYKLIENVNDIQVSKETGKISLAPSTLVVETYNLNTNTKISNIDPKQDIPGTTAYTNNVFDYENDPTNVVGTMTVNVEDQKSIAEFRRASRLLINVDIFDNCGYLPLQAASIKVENLSTVDGGVMLDKPIKCDVSHDELGNLSNYKNKPRGAFTIDLPMQVDNSVNNQLKITVYAKDNQGNERELIIPVKLVESTFETRVLETKEERK